MISQTQVNGPSAVHDRPVLSLGFLLQVTLQISLLRRSWASSIGYDLNSAYFIRLLWSCSSIYVLVCSSEVCWTLSMETTGPAQFHQPTCFEYASYLSGNSFHGEHC